jgi:DMSO/TMAO reductase YedYZ molybdopterin-dependent catalytic subunit
MRPRVVDWALFGLILFELLSGYGSFLVGKPQGRVIFVVHGMVGLAIVGLLILKLRRVYPRLAPARWQAATLVSIATTLLAVAAVASGLYWSMWQQPLGYPNGMILHTLFGSLLFVVYLWHMVLRYKPLRRHDVSDRRSLLTALGLLLAGGAAWGLVERINHAARLPGAVRRFTGSRLADGGLYGPFPVTIWLLDNPAPIDEAKWHLVVGGLVVRPESFTLAQIAGIGSDVVDAALDCTGGWYTVQEWRGVQVGRVLEHTGIEPEGRYVRFVSVTGYRWSLPLAEARTALLATHAGEQKLGHWHGAPLRLVAPGRRGFQWVKWIVRVEVLPGPDMGQWQAIFTSGLS